MNTNNTFVLMRVALLTNFIPPYRKSLYSALGEHLDDFTIFISQEMEKNRNWEVDHGDLKVIVQKGVRYTKKWKGRYGYNEKSVIQIPYDTFFKLRKNKPDIVISAELGIRSLLAMVYCKLHSKPLIIWLALSEHTEKNKKKARLFLRKIILKNSKAILCNGKSAERYVKSLGITKKMFFVPYTSDFELIQHIHEKKNVVRTILFTGQLIERKGVEEMVNAIQQWSIENKSKKLTLVVAGDGPEKIKFNLLNELPNIELKLLGTIPYKDLQDLYKTSDLYIFPTLADEWGVVVNEAMASGLPVLGSLYSQAVEELIIDGKNGWVFEPDSQKTFVSALTKALETSPEKWKEIGMKNIKDISNFTPKKVSENIYKALNYASEHK